MSTDELKHYGILGMHWGIRRYQPYPKGSKANGTYKPEKRPLSLTDQYRVLDTAYQRLERKGRRIDRLRKKADKLNAKAEKHELKGGQLIRTEFSDDRLRKAARERARAKRLINKSDKLVAKGEKYANRVLEKYDNTPQMISIEDQMMGPEMVADYYRSVKERHKDIEKWSTTKKR